jgi:hypothetical protein
MQDIPHSSPGWSEDATRDVTDRPQYSALEDPVGRSPRRKTRALAEAVETLTLTPRFRVGELGVKLSQAAASDRRRQVKNLAGLCSPLRRTTSILFETPCRACEGTCGRNRPSWLPVSWWHRRVGYPAAEKAAGTAAPATARTPRVYPGEHGASSAMSNGICVLLQTRAWPRLARLRRKIVPSPRLSALRQSWRSGKRRNGQQWRPRRALFLDVAAPVAAQVSSGPVRAAMQRDSL